MDYNKLSPIKQTYLSLRKALNISGQGLEDDVLQIMPDSMVEVLVKKMETFLEESPTRHNMGGIVSLNQLTQPIGYR